MARVTGIGGIFLRARDPRALTDWYAKHLGMPINENGNETGVNFLWSDQIPASTGMTAWTLFPQDTAYFGPSRQPAMINFRVDDLDGMLKQLAAAGVPIDAKREEYKYGRFAWIIDPEGNRVELWQPLAVILTRVTPVPEEISVLQEATAAR